MASDLFPWAVRPVSLLGGRSLLPKWTGSFWRDHGGIGGLHLAVHIFFNIPMIIDRFIYCKFIRAE